MPVLTSSGPPAVTELAGLLASDLSDGRVARQTFGSRKVAFEWATGLPMTLARQVASAVVDGLSFGATRVSPSLTPAAKVVAGGTKPDAVTITTSTVGLTKYAGLANIQTEQSLDTDGLMSALANVLTNSCLLAFDADCALALGTDAGLDAGGADWPSAILAGVGEVASNGSAPGVLLLSAADYATAVQSPGPGYAMNPLDGVPSLFGLRVVLSASVASGTGYVLDPAAVLAVENANSPVAVVDPFSGLSTNAVRLAVEFFAAFVVASPGGVCEITVAPAGARKSTGGGKKLTRDDVDLGA